MEFFKDRHIIYGPQIYLGRMLFIFQVRLTNYRLLRFLKYLAELYEGGGGGGGVNDVTTFLENIIMDHKYQEDNF